VSASAVLTDRFGARRMAPMGRKHSLRNGRVRPEPDISVPNLIALKPTLVPDDHACAVT
jgi:hypothetical protein